MLRAEVKFLIQDFFKKDGKVIFEVVNVKSFAGYVLHMGYLSGEIKVKEQVVMAINRERRKTVMSNHTFTHILNFGLRKILGNDVDQRGSLVEPQKLRFDFSHNKPMTVDQITKVESICNSFITQNLPVYALEIPLETAKQITSLRAVFGENYPNPVRVISIGKSVEDLVKNPSNPDWIEFSIELCGGTHLQKTGQTSNFIIVSEVGISKGVRRIIAQTGEEAQQTLKRAQELKERMVAAKTLRGEALSSTIAFLTYQLDTLDLSAIDRAQLLKDLDGLISSKLSGKKDTLKELIAKVEEMTTSLDPKTKSVIEIVEAGSDRKALDAAVKALRDKLPEAFIALFSKDDKKVMLMTSVPKNKTSELNAGDCAKTLSNILGGKGGGSAENGQGSGIATKLSEAIQTAREMASKNN